MPNQTRFSLAKAFETSIGNTFAYWERFAPGLKSVLLRAWEDAHDRHNLEIAKQHVMMALFGDPQVRAHLQVAEFDVVKLESQVALQLAQLETIATNGHGAADAASAVSWSSEVIDALNHASTTSDHHGQASVDIWMVYDFLERDAQFTGFYAVARKKFASDHDRHAKHLRDIEDNYHQTRHEVRETAHEVRATAHDVRELAQALRQAVTRVDQHQGNLRSLESLLREHLREFNRIKSAHPDWLGESADDPRGGLRALGTDDAPNGRRWFHWRRPKPSPTGAGASVAAAAAPGPQRHGSHGAQQQKLNGATPWPADMHPRAWSGAGSPREASRPPGVAGFRTPI